MPIRYPPLPGDVLICDFATGFRPPEMVKRRPVLVLSPRLRHRDGLCTVVPLSTTPPARAVPYQCRLTLPFAPPPPFQAVEVWAKADMLATVAYARLDLMRTGRDQTGKRKYLKMHIALDDLERVRGCVIQALGLGVNLT
jgi:uncharacterized protein YifN (PemK superfamily)